MTNYTVGRWLAFVFLLILAGCGFKLRGAVELPENRRNIALAGIEWNHPLAQDLQETLALSNGQLVQDQKQAQSLLRILEIGQDKQVLSLDENGKAIEFELLYRVRFDMLDPKGQPIMAPQDVEIVRTYLNPQLQIIGKSQEEDLLRDEMRKEAVRTMLWRIQRALADRTSRAG